jgi:hypothetical protein
MLWQVILALAMAGYSFVMELRRETDSRPDANGAMGAELSPLNEYLRRPRVAAGICSEGFGAARGSGGNSEVGR